MSDASLIVGIIIILIVIIVLYTLVWFGRYYGNNPYAIQCNIGKLFWILTFEIIIAILLADLAIKGGRHHHHCHHSHLI